jgi:hypothetical protein
MLDWVLTQGGSLGMSAEGSRGLGEGNRGLEEGVQALEEGVHQALEEGDLLCWQ